MKLTAIIIIGIALSMDAFSLALAYGTLGIKRKDILKLSIIVGLYHFIMPLLGTLFGEIIIKYIKVPSNIIVFIILLFIGINLIRESFENKKVSNKNNLFDFLAFGLAVSIDSFSVGIGLETVTSMHLQSSLIFCLLSCFFTLVGLILGKKVKTIFGKVSTIIGGVLLIIIAITYLYH
ncbi:MAG: manganese efflux pump [Bacilli bacterium]